MIASMSLFSWASERKSMQLFANSHARTCISTLYMYMYMHVYTYMYRKMDIATMYICSAIILDDEWPSNTDGLT